MTQDASICKLCGASDERLTYQLSSVDVYVCQACRLHYTHWLYPEPDVEPSVDPAALTDDRLHHIEKHLHFNAKRLNRHVALVASMENLQGARVLDIGCGGGLFLRAIKEEGADAVGIDLADDNIVYAKKYFDIDVIKLPVEYDYWQANYQNSFDIITLWDVIEHVNDPIRTLRAAAQLVRPGGIVAFETPYRDAFFHRTGELTYRLTRGRVPSFLNNLYGAGLFAHKQIFSISDIGRLVEASGLRTIDQRKIHEFLSPARYHLKRLISNETLLNIMDPVVEALFKVIRIPSKVTVVARK